MSDKDHPIWNVEEGDKFERDKGTPDVWEVVEIEETPGFGTPVRKVTFAATEYNEKAEKEGVPGAADIQLRTDSDGNCPQFDREFAEIDR